MIKAVLFDYGGVLSPGGGANAFLHLVANALGVAPQHELDTILDDFRRASIDEATCLARIHELYPGAPPVPEDIFGEGSGELVRSQPVYDLAEALRRAGVTTSILSDVYLPVAEMLRTHGNYDGFDPLFLSCNEHLLKPDPAFYHLVITRLNLRPDEILFIDDQERCLAPARQLGMHTILAMSADQIVQDTKQLVGRYNKVEI